MISKVNSVMAVAQSNIGETADQISDIDRLIMRIETSRITADEMFAEVNNRLSSTIDRINSSIVELEIFTASNLTRTDGVINSIIDRLNVRDDNILELIRNSPTFQSRTRFLVNFSLEAGHAFKSCATISQLSPSTPSGYYNIRSGDGSVISEYCDMTRSCGGITGGWRRVIALDMRKPGSQCPDNLVADRRNRPPSITCRKRNISSDCSSSKISVNGAMYSSMCGKIIGYQVGSTSAFGAARVFIPFPTINDYYVDGVSLTYGKFPRQHIWTFAGAVNENPTFPKRKCACINTDISTRVPNVPMFVGGDYFCDTAALTGFGSTFYGDDPLWDGAGCGPKNMCCTFNNPPWFYKKLLVPTHDDIDMRLCFIAGGLTGKIVIEIIEIYVQ